MNNIPLWQVLLMHAAPLIAALAAWRSAAMSGRTSMRNEDAILVVHGLVNGDLATARCERDVALAELAAMRAKTHA